MKNKGGIINLFYSSKLYNFSKMNIENKTITSVLSTPSDEYCRWVVYGIVTLHGELNGIPITKPTKNSSLDKLSKRVYVMWNGEHLIYWIPNLND